MASLSKNNRGGWYIQFEDRDLRRRTITLGKISKRSAVSTRLRVEQLVSAQLSGSAPDPETSRWLTTIGEKLFEKLGRVELVEQRQNATIGPFIDYFLSSREADPKVKPRTVASYRASYAHLRKHFGDAKPLRSITKGDAQAWRATIAEGDKRGENTIRKWTAKVKTLFNSAIDHELIERNPFDGLAARTVKVRDRDYFVSREEADKVLAACPSSDWRVIFALARYGALRCPSEVLELRWGDILWDQNRFIVRSVKTEHHEGHETRVVPLFPELRTHLEAAFDVAEDGAEFVVTKTRDGAANFRTTLTKVIERAGLKPWPKLFQNLRATRATELANEYPGYVATAWCGHNEQIARDHYWQVKDEHFDSAASDTKCAANALQKVSAKSGIERKPERPISKEHRENVVFPLIEQLADQLGVAETGLEPVQEFPPGGF